MDNLSIAVGFFVVAGIVLSGLIVYESRKINEFNTMMEMFIESNADIFTAVNNNANVTREIISKVSTVERVAEYHSIILDGHAHVLKIYSPALNFSDIPLSDKIQDFKNLGD